MNNSYKSYGVWEGVRKNPGGGLDLGGRLGGQESKKGLRSGRDLEDLGRGLGSRRGCGIGRGMGSLRGSGVSEGSLGSQREVRGSQRWWGLGKVSEHRGRTFGHMEVSKYTGVHLNIWGHTNISECIDAP